ncbi:MAG: hypothetical protein ACJ764_11255 [Solirubrobacteraceae bacterium]
MFQHGKKALAGVAALAALALGASAIATAASSGTSTPRQGTSSTHPPLPFNCPAPGTAAHEDAEKPVTGTDAAKAQAAAVKALGGGTAGAVTTDYFGKGFEVTVTKSDGTKVEVHMDSSYNVMPRPGGPRPGGPPGGPPPGYSR